MLSREDDMLLLALSGPVLITMSVAVLASMPLYLAQFLFLMIYVGAVLALAGFAACIVSLVSKKTRGRPKLRYVMLGLLDLLFLCLTLIFEAIRRSWHFG